MKNSFYYNPAKTIDIILNEHGNDVTCYIDPFNTSYIHNVIQRHAVSLFKHIDKVIHFSYINNQTAFLYLPKEHPNIVSEISLNFVKKRYKYQLPPRLWCKNSRKEWCCLDFDTSLMHIWDRTSMYTTSRAKTL